MFYRIPGGAQWGMFFAVFFLASTAASAQFSFEGEVLERAQVRNGARRLPSPNDEPAAFWSQRTRLTANYRTQDFGTYASFQDVRVWGEYDQENVGPTLNVYKAYGELYFGERVILKAGRQGLHYDDGYLFADPNWREAGRTHDGIRLTFEDSTFSFHLGGMFNAVGASAFRQPYVVNTYQNMQWLWTKKAIGDNSHIAAIAVRRQFNVMTPTGETPVDTYTLGGEAASGLGPLSMKLVGYYQLGQDRTVRDLQAWFAALRLHYRLDKLRLAAFGHLVSGTSTENFLNASGKQSSFDILYGFRHRFFGTMDYFYSTTYDPYAGLQNIMVMAEWSPLDRLWLRADVHYFAAQAEVRESLTGAVMPNYLGTEVDLSFTYNWKPQVQFKGGYSQLWGTSTLAALVGGDPNETANWLWIQMYLTPTFFTTQK
ncbi:MAG: alginate export family protein [Bacteroidota bacterium]